MPAADVNLVNTQLNTPKHIALIMDGNGRWAKKHHLPKLAGHKKGAEAARAIVLECIELHISYVTLYAFSSENWNRSPDEVNDLMGLLKLYLEKELPLLHKHNVKLRIIGDRSRLDQDIVAQIEKAEALTQDNTSLTALIALSYGSQQEIIHAVQNIARDVQSEAVAVDAIDERLFVRYLYTDGIPAPDLLIRTSGEQRLSNFLLWQLAYAELFFTDILWPDFTPDDLHHAIQAFNLRERRYGST